MMLDEHSQGDLLPPPKTKKTEKRPFPSKEIMDGIHGFLKFNLMYFQKLFYEYERLYVSKIKDSKQIYPLSANIYLHTLNNIKKI